jgi:hypothetical protein
VRVHEVADSSDEMNEMKQHTCSNDATKFSCRDRTFPKLPLCSSLLAGLVLVYVVSLMKWRMRVAAVACTVDIIVDYNRTVISCSQRQWDLGAVLGKCSDCDLMPGIMNVMREKH